MGSGDAGHSVPDSRGPGPLTLRSSDTLFHPSISPVPYFHHPLLKPSSGPQRPSGGAPWWGSVAALPGPGAQRVIATPMTRRDDPAR